MRTVAFQVEVKPAGVRAPRSLAVGPKPATTANAIVVAWGRRQATPYRGQREARPSRSGGRERASERRRVRRRRRKRRPQWPTNARWRRGSSRRMGCLTLRRISSVLAFLSAPLVCSTCVSWLLVSHGFSQQSFLGVGCARTAARLRQRLRRWNPARRAHWLLRLLRLLLLLLLEQQTLWRWARRPNARRPAAWPRACAQTHRPNASHRIPAAVGGIMVAGALEVVEVAIAVPIGLASVAVVLHGRERNGACASGAAASGGPARRPVAVVFGTQAVGGLEKTCSERERCQAARRVFFRPPGVVKAAAVAHREAIAMSVVVCVVVVVIVAAAKAEDLAVLVVAAVVIAVAPELRAEVMMAVASITTFGTAVAAIAVSVVLVAVQERGGHAAGGRRKRVACDVVRFLVVLQS